MSIETLSQVPVMLPQQTADAKAKAQLWVLKYALAINVIWKASADAKAKAQLWVLKCKIRRYKRIWWRGRCKS